MSFLDCLVGDSIIDDLISSSINDVLREMGGTLLEKVGFSTSRRESVIEDFMIREKLGSTGVGDGVAFPHAQRVDVDRILCTVARSKRGVDFNSLDSRPVHLFFMFVSPCGLHDEYRKVLKRLSDDLGDDHFRADLLSALDSREIFELFRRLEASKS